MTKPLSVKVGEQILFDAIVPPLSPDRYPLGADLIAGGAGNTVEAGSASGQAQATIEVTGPRLALGPGDIVSLYPPRDAADAADTMLASVVLRRRTLPWERPVSPGVPRTTPWMAVLLFKKSEARIEAGKPFSLTGRSLPGVDPAEPCDQLVVPSALLARVLPRAAELPLLCHARLVDRTETAAIKDDDGYISLVLGNRLPQASTDYLAALVSLEGVYAEFLAPGAAPPATGETRLVALVSWSFHTGKSGDFEAYCHRLDGLGGSKMIGRGAAKGDPTITDPLGRIDLPAPTADDRDRKVVYAGPAVPLPLAPTKRFVRNAEQAREQTPDGRPLVSYAAAFELGRLLALGSPAALRDLLSLRHGQVSRDPDFTLKYKPKTLDDLRDWRKVLFGGAIDQPWFDELDRFGSDPTGVAHLGGFFPGLDESLGDRFLDAHRSRLVLGERWTGAAQSAEKSTLTAPLSADAATLEARFSALPQLAAAPTPGVKR